MWPKALLQLLELVPHFSRLLPMADKFFQNKSGMDDATLKSMADLRAELGQTTASHVGLYRQMNEQSEKLAATAADARAAKIAAEASEARLELVEKKMAKQSGLLMVTTGTTLLLLVLVIVLLLRH